MSVKVHEAFCLDSARRRFLFEDHFLGDSLRDLWTNTGSAGGSGAVVDAQDGGIIRLTTDGDNGDLWEINWNLIRTLLVSKKVTLEFRFKLNAITNVAFQPQLRFDGNNRITINFNTGVDTTYHIETKDGGAATNVDSGVTPDTDYHIWRIETTPTSVAFFYDGTEVTNSPLTTNIGTDYYQPRLLLQTLENVAKSVDIDYVVIRQDR